MDPGSHTFRRRQHRHPRSAGSPSPSSGGRTRVSSASGFEGARLERQLQTSLGPHSTRDDLCCTVYALAAMAAQLAGGDPIPPNVMADHAVTALRLGPGDAAQHTRHHVAQCVITHTGGAELVGMAEFASASEDDLLETDSSLGSNTDSSRGSHHPSRECFMAGSPKGHVESLEDSPSHSRNRTPPPTPAPARGGRRPTQPPPAPAPVQGDGRSARQQWTQLLTCQKELEETQLQLE